MIQQRLTFLGKERRQTLSIKFSLKYKTDQLQHAIIKILYELPKCTLNNYSESVENNIEQISAN